MSEVWAQTGPQCICVSIVLVLGALAIGALFLRDVWVNRHL